MRSMFGAGRAGAPPSPFIHLQQGVRRHRKQRAGGEPAAATGLARALRGTAGQGGGLPPGCSPIRSGAVVHGGGGGARQREGCGGRCGVHDGRASLSLPRQRGGGGGGGAGIAPLPPGPLLLEGGREPPDSLGGLLDRGRRARDLLEGLGAHGRLFPQLHVPPVGAAAEVRVSDRVVAAAESVHVVLADGEGVEGQQDGGGVGAGGEVGVDDRLAEDLGAPGGIARLALSTELARARGGQQRQRAQPVRALLQLSRNLGDCDDAAGRQRGERKGRREGRLTRGRTPHSTLERGGGWVLDRSAELHEIMQSEWRFSQGDTMEPQWDDGRSSTPPPPVSHPKADGAAIPVVCLLLPIPGGRRARTLLASDIFVHCGIKLLQLLPQGRIRAVGGEGAGG